MKSNFKAKRKRNSAQKPSFNHRDGSFVKNGVNVFLEYRLKEFFRILHDQKNEVVTREELKDFVWKDVIVSDESITKAASDLRKFFRTHDIGEYRLITIPKVGYKLETLEWDFHEIHKPGLIIRALKLSGYVFLFFLFLIMVVRAINY